MNKYRKKPVVIEADRWLGHVEGREDALVRYFRRPDIPSESACPACGLTMHIHGFIDTLEDGHRVCPGDWVIKGIAGEFYPCKPDIFDATYEAVTP